MVGGPRILIHFYITVVRDPQFNRNDNRYHADAPFSNRLCPRTH